MASAGIEPATFRFVAQQGRYTQPPYRTFISCTQNQTVRNDTEFTVAVVWSNWKMELWNEALDLLLGFWL